MGAEDLILRLESLALQIRDAEDRLRILERQRADVRERLRLLTAGRDAGVDAMIELPSGGQIIIQAKSADRPTSGELYAARVMRDYGGTVTRGWLADRLGCSLDAASIKLARMAQKGLIRRVAKGAYIVPPTPSAEEYVTVPIGEDVADEPKRVPLGADEEVRA